MKHLLSALAFAACVAAAPAWAAEQEQGPTSAETYATMYAYSQASPHARQLSPTVEQAADQKAAEANRTELAQWSSVMGRGDVPEEYLDKVHK